MKIFLVAIPNHHFFQWANQLKASGYDVYWFDITDGAGFVERINWVKQFNGWKLKWTYPFRYKVKRNFPKLYYLLEKITVNKIDTVIDALLKKIQPDIVHCFEMKLAGLPILSVMNTNKIPLVYSSWGSDIFDYKNLGVTTPEAKSFLNRVDYLITDCNRDFTIAQQLGFATNFLGVFPGNGGIEIETSYIQPLNNRKTICIKGYDDGVGKALVVIKAIESMQLDQLVDFLVFSADEIVENYLRNSDYFKQRNVEIISRKSFISNKLLLQKLGYCLLYIGNSSSDGMPNTLLESMGMGVFPIQSNPGKVTEEILIDGLNGFLIDDPDDVKDIANLIKKAVEDQEMRFKAQKYNSIFIQKNYSRAMLERIIIDLYKSIKLN